MSFGDLWWTYEGVVLSIGVNGLLALSVYLVLATGQLFLAQGAFMAIGAYASALLSLDFGFPLYASLPIAVAISGCLALIISWPMLRLSGVYLGIGTIAFGEVLRTVAINSDALGGALGLNNIPLTATPLIVYLFLFTCILACWAARCSKIGRAMDAIRTDETAAQVLGIDLIRYKTAVVVVSSMIAGLAGVLNAHSHSSISPADFGFEETVAILSFAIVGGTASPLGSVLGAVVLTSLPEVLRGLSNYRPMIDGLIIVLVVAFRPDGLLSWRTVKGHAYA